MANIAKIEPGATQCQYLMKIMRQMWKLANIAKMSLSADQQQYPMKIIREFWKTGQYRENESKSESMSISHGNHRNNLDTDHNIAKMVPN